MLVESVGKIVGNCVKIFLRFVRIRKERSHRFLRPVSSLVSRIRCIAVKINSQSGTLWLTCAKGVRRFGGVHRVMILQKLHLCEISGRSRP